MLKKYFIWIRFSLLLFVWLPFSVFSIRYFLQEQKAVSFPMLLLSNGSVSFIQQENWFYASQTFKPHDRLIKVSGIPFHWNPIKEWLSNQKESARVSLLAERGGKEFKTTIFLKKYTQSQLLTFFYLPFFLSLIFLIFSLAVPFQKSLTRRAREAVEVFCLICFGFSLFFLTLLPSLTLGIPISFSLLLPLLGMGILHLFLIYPKKKCSPKMRFIFLALGYGLSLLVVGVRGWDWFENRFPWLEDIHLFTPVIHLLAAMGALTNTLFTSQDFWARRRARLTSLMMLASFIFVVSLFVASLWQGPRISLERVLVAPLFFPTAFAVVFLKGNIFDLERMFRRGLHQLLLFSMAMTLAVLVGLLWTKGYSLEKQDWILWVVISIVVLAVARPLGMWLENQAHRFIQTRVKYPSVDQLFEQAGGLEGFLSNFSEHCETFLNFKNICFRFFQDPTLPWKEGNEQCWQFKEKTLHRFYDSPLPSLYVSKLIRGNIAIGEISWDGGDAIAFDPATSQEWNQVIRSLARGVEILCLREFIVLQQGLQAAGRMQALLAHELKNPLAIVNVCSGLLLNHVGGDEEAEELVRTIREEVRRVTKGVQGIFSHSGKIEARQKISLGQLLSEVKENAHGRFPRRTIDISFWMNEKLEGLENLFWVWMEKEGLRQSLLNLIINAFEAGSLAVHLEVHLTSYNFFIKVKDQGPGIPKKIELFKPFVTTKATGTGLGLAHVKAFVDRHRGAVRVESQTGKGATFVLEFSKQFVMNEVKDE